MKKLNFLFGLATMFATAFTFSSCSSEELSGENKVSGRQVNFTSAMKGSTRATSDPQSTTVPTGQKVGVFGISDEASTTMTNYNNIQYTVPESGNLTTTNAMTWPTADGAKVSFYAYAPYNSDWTSHTTAQTFTVASDQSAEAGYLASDLLFATPLTDKTVTTDALALAFVHKMAKLNITLNNTGTSDITISSVKINNTLPSIAFTPSDGTLGATSETATDITAASNLAIAASSGTANVCAVVVPQSIAANTTLVTITTSDSKTLIAKLGSETTFASGGSYNFTVNINISESTPATSEVVLLSGTTTITSWTGNNLGADRLFATFGSCGSKAKYNYPIFSWTASSDNLMPMFTFSNGELANYKSLYFSISDLSNGPARIQFFVNNDTKEEILINRSGKHVIDLTNITGINLSDVTEVRIGGKSESGSCHIEASDVYLSPNPPTIMYATFGTPGNKASYVASTNTYSWSDTSSNLMDCFEFSNGQLANYKTLKFKLSNLSGGMVRIGYYVGSTWTEIGNGYGSNGEKPIDLTGLNVDLKTVTKICFGGRSLDNSSTPGSVVIKASEMYLLKE